MAELNQRDPRNPRVPIKCPRCAVSLTYLGTFPEAKKSEPWAPPAPLMNPDITHVYSCITHGRFWLNDAVGLKAAPKD